MTRFAGMLLLSMAACFPALADAPSAEHPIRLEAGDFRWMTFTVRQTPSEVDCRYEVLDGEPSVRVELLPLTEFRAFSHGRDHQSMALTPKGRSGEFRRILDERGQYAVVVENARDARPATILLHVQTKVNPGADVARTLSPARRLSVIVVSFAFFIITVAWSGRKLLRAMRI